jgi:hypothetical protein
MINETIFGRQALFLFLCENYSLTCTFICDKNVGIHYVYHCMKDIFSTDSSSKHRGKDNNMYTSTNEITLHLLSHIYRDEMY